MLSSKIHLFIQAMALSAAMMIPGLAPAGANSTPTLLTDPFLQVPSATSVNVVWMTEFEGTRHIVQFGSAIGDSKHKVSQRLAGVPWLRFAKAETSRFSRLREDAGSNVAGRDYTEESERPIWRHEAVIRGLRPGVRIPYRVMSLTEDGTWVKSDLFTLSAAPPPSQPLKILLTSDHQLKANTPANLQKVKETIGQVDAVLIAGDLINIPDRASEWFDDSNGGAFFPALQGRASKAIEDKSGTTTVFTGGQLIQHAPMFTVIGNHEVMGRVSEGNNLNGEFNDPKPREVAERAYEAVAAEVNPDMDPEIRARWIEDNSYNADTYLEMFTLPTSRSGGEKWYATTFGNVRIIGLYATRIWRGTSTTPSGASKYVEATATLDDEMAQGWGTHIFERIDAGSAQYEWLERELKRPEFARAKYQVVMLHHPIHNVGGNVIPAFTDPVRIEENDAEGALAAVRYEYPLADDYLVRDIEPLLVEAGVDLVLNGHSHLWNRFQHPAGTHFLETSNVGNSYGAFTAQNDQSRPVPGAPWDPANYIAQGDPAGLEPFVPNVEPVLGDDALAYPFVASNDHTAFSILDTGSGDVTTYVYDTRDANGKVRVLDRFSLD